MTTENAPSTSRRQFLSGSMAAATAERPWISNLFEMCLYNFLVMYRISVVFLFISSTSSKYFPKSSVNFKTKLRLKTIDKIQ